MNHAKLPPHTGRLIAASAEESSDILYGSGFSAADEFCYVELPDGSRVVLVYSLELQRAQNEVCKGIRVMDRFDVIRQLPMPERQTTNYFVALSRYFDIRHWIVPQRFPFSHADAMMKAGITVEAQQGDFFPERAVKTADEIACITETMKVTQEAMYQVHDYMAAAKVNSDNLLVLNGEILTCDYIRSQVEAEFKRKGYTAFRTIIACGADASAPHCIGSGPVRARETVVADIFPRSDSTGYWGDMTRTFVKGEAKPVVRKAFEAVKLASEKVMEILKPGISGEFPHNMAREIMEDAVKTRMNENGIPCGFIHGLGHGVGLDIHENPRLTQRNPELLVPGNVVTVEPGLYDPAWGGIRLEDTVVITETGYKNFCTMPKELEIL